MKRLFTSLSVLCIVVMLAACSGNGNSPGKSSGPSESGSTATSGASSGGILKVALSAEPTAFNPYTWAQAIDRQVFLQIFNSLMEYDPVTFDVLPGLVKQADVSDDGLTYTLHLQEGVTFHNGKPMTGDDVKASIEKSQAEDAPRTNGLLKTIETITVDSDTQVTLKLSRPDSLLLDSLVEVYVTPNDPAIDHQQSPVGTGPFKFVSWNRNEKVVLTKYDKYWKAGLPKLDGVEFYTVPDGEVKILQLINGQMDFIDVVPTSKLEQIKNDPNLLVAELPLSAAIGDHFLLMNNSVAPMNNVNFRKAVNYAIDRDKISAALFGNFTNRTTAIPEGHEFYNSENVSYYPRNVDKAKELLAASGYKGEALEYVYIKADSMYSIVAQIIEQSLKEIGINISSKEMETAQWVDKVTTKHDFQLASTGIVPKPNPVDLLNHAYGKQNGLAIQWENKEWLVKLLNASSLPPEQYKAAILELQQVVQDETPAVIVGGLVSTPGFSKKVEGFIASPQSKFIFEAVTKSK